MERRRALFITLTSLSSARKGQTSSTVTDRFRDFAARGYRIFLVTDRLEYGDCEYHSRVELLAAVRSDPNRHYAAPVTGVVMLSNNMDPKPFWDAARRFNLSLGNSTFISSHGEYLSAARNAGVERSELSDDLFGE
jgi:hypothetical protein